MQSIYFGGGTPSLLSYQELQQIFEQLSKYYSWTKDIEITLEANPDDLSSQKLKDLRTIGINRLSIGIQSFYEEDLKFMNRAHNAEEAVYCVPLAQDKGFDNISIDLIYGSSTTSMEMWNENIMKTIALNVNHISAYCLTVEEGTALHHFIKTGKTAPVEDTKAIAQFDMIMDLLQDAGYDHYEISNYALPDHYAVHNTSYWQGKAYLGIGPSAHSYNGISRKWNLANNVKYIKAIQCHTLPYEEEVLSDADNYNEYMMTGLRTKWGVDINHLNSPFQEYFLKNVSNFIKNGGITIDKGIYRLTRSGKHYADFIAMNLFYDQ